MRDVRIDDDGELRCWKCGCAQLQSGRTRRSWVLLGLSALATKSKFRCARCGAYNQVGHGKPYRGPLNLRYRHEWKAEQAERRDAASQSEVEADLSAAQLEAVEAQRAQERRQAHEALQMQQAQHARARRARWTRRIAAISAIGSHSERTVPSWSRPGTAGAADASRAIAMWYPDPLGRGQLRYWDGAQWTEHVSSAGVMSVDPLQPVGQSTGSSAATSNDATEQTDDGTQVAEVESPTETISDQLHELAEMYRDGLLSEEEFAAAKAQALGETDR